MKKLTLNQTWVLCLRMWRWIAHKWEEGDVVWKLKDQWLIDNGYSDIDLQHDCFFCEWAVLQRLSKRNEIQKRSEYIHGQGCKKWCPGCKVDSEFNCRNSKYNYDLKPKAFYAELLRLNQIRKGGKCQGVT